MKSLHVLAAFTVVLSLAACGGGGGGGDSSAPSVAQSPVTVPVVGPTTPVTLSTVDPHLFHQGFSVSFNGALSAATAVLWQGAVDTGTAFAGTTTLGGNGAAVNSGNIVTFAPNVRPVYGKPFVLVITATDTLGRPITVTIPFSTSAMSCVNTAVWSNPATFSEPLQDCVAPIGVQALVTPANTLQDNSCTITTGAPLTPTCHVYLANGTMLLADTALVVNGHATTWMAYVGTDGKSNIVLLDTNDPNNPVPIGTTVLSNPLVWEIGNPTGESISIKTGVTGNETDQVTWDTTSGILKRTCLVRCA